MDMPWREWLIIILCGIGGLMAGLWVGVTIVVKWVLP